MLGLVCVVFTGAGIFWAHSPTVKAEKAYQRQHAIEFLQEQKYGMLSEDVQKVMDEYHITEAEIKSPLSQ